MLNAWLDVPTDATGDWLDVLRRAADAGAVPRRPEDERTGGSKARAARVGRPCGVGAALCRPDLRRAIVSADARDGYGWGTRAL
jgi:hypothetical protein